MFLREYTLNCIYKRCDVYYSTLNLHRPWPSSMFILNPFFFELSICKNYNWEITVKDLKDYTNTYHFPGKVIH